MPFFDQEALIRTKPKPKSKVDSKVRDNVFLTNLVTYINDMFQENVIQIINDAEAVEHSNSYNGYIEQGVVYVNVQNPEHLMHELSHVTLAIMKHKSPEKYYALLSNVQKSETYKVLDTSGAYKHLRGADFLEEVLAQDLGKFLSGQLTGWLSEHESEIESVLDEQPDELLKILFPDVNSDFQFVIPEMKEALKSMTQVPSELQMILQEDQKLLNLKSRLFKGYQKNKQRMKLKADCK